MPKASAKCNEASQETVHVGRGQHLHTRQNACSLPGFFEGVRSQSFGRKAEQLIW